MKYKWRNLVNQNLNLNCEIRILVTSITIQGCGVFLTLFLIRI